MPPPSRPREAEDIVNHRGHAHYRGLHHGDDLVLLLVLDSSVENSRGGAYGSEGIAKIMPKHGDELCTQFGGFVLQSQHLLRRLLGSNRQFSSETTRQAMITVHHLDDSRSQRILWLLEELGLPYEIKLQKRDSKTRLAPPELKRVHPIGKSPVIEDDSQVVAESGAIIEYILRKYGNGRLQPASSDATYDDYLRWMHYAEGSGMPALIVRINVARLGEAATPALPRFDTEIGLHLSYLNDALARHPYILGDELSAADIQLSFIGELAAVRFGISTYPNIEPWVKRFQARPAYKDALNRGGTYSFAA